MSDAFRKDYLVVKDVAEKINVSGGAVRVWLRKGLLKGYKVGSEIRILPEDLAEFIDSDK